MIGSIDKLDRKVQYYRDNWSNKDYQIPQVLFLWSKKTGPDSPLPPLIFLKLILRFTQNPLPPLNFPQVKPQVLKQNFRFFKRTKVQQLYHDDCHPSLSEMKYFEMKWRKFDIFWPSFPQVLNIFLKFYVCRPPSHPIFLRFFHKFSIFSGLNPLPPLFLGPQKIRTWGKNRRSLIYKPKNQVSCLRNEWVMAV